jgi:hypothetical protein
LWFGSGAATDPWVAPDLGQIGQPEPASSKAVWSFPQAIAFIWKVDTRNGSKIQDVVVFC